MCDIYVKELPLSFWSKKYFFAVMETLHLKQLCIVIAFMLMVMLLKCVLTVFSASHVLSCAGYQLPHSPAGQRAGSGCSRTCTSLSASDASWRAASHGWRPERAHPAWCPWEHTSSSPGPSPRLETETTPRSLLWVIEQTFFIKALCGECIEVCFLMVQVGGLCSLAQVGGLGDQTQNPSASGSNT